MKKSAPDACPSGARDVLPNYFRLVARKNFEQVVFAVLLGKEKPRLAFLESLRADQTADRAVSLGHVQPGRLVIFVRRQRIQTKRDESGYDISLRMLLVQLVSPNRIEFV